MLSHPISRSRKMAFTTYMVTTIHTAKHCSSTTLAERKITASMVRGYSLKIKTCGINIRQPVSCFSAKVVDEQCFAVWMVVTIYVVKAIFLDLEIGCENICP